MHKLTVQYKVYNTHLENRVNFMLTSYLIAV